MSITLLYLMTLLFGLRNTSGDERPGPNDELSA